MDCECLISGNKPSVLDFHTTSRVEMAGSDISLIISEKRARLLNDLINLYTESNFVREENSNHSKSLELANIDDPCLHSSQMFLNSLMLGLNISFTSLEVSVSLDISRDNIESRLTDTEIREIIFEESLSDFISNYACFELNFPPIESIKEIMIICRDRLFMLGMTYDDAEECIERARIAFVDNLTLLKNATTEDTCQSSKRVQSEINENSIKSEEIQSGSSNIDSCNVSDMNSTHSNSCDDSSNEYIAAQSHCSNEPYPNSDDSLKLIETAMKNAVELARKSVSLPSGNAYNSLQFKEILEIHIDTSNISLQYFLLDKRVSFQSNSITVRNISGIRMIDISYVDPRFADSNDSNDSNEMLSAKEEKFINLFRSYKSVAVCDEDETSISLSIFEKRDNVDVDDVDHGELKKRIQSCKFMIHCIDITFVAVDWAKVIDLVLSFRSIFNRAVVVGTNLSSIGEQTFKDVSGSITSSSFLFASDTIAPFMKVTLTESMIHGSNSYDSPSSIKLESKLVDVKDLTPEGQLFSGVIATEVHNERSRSGDMTNNLPTMREHFILEVISYKDFWQNPPEINIKFTDVKFYLLRQFLNEFLQYLLNPSYGIAFVLNLIYGELPLDANGNPPPPMKYKISLLNSIIILPRDNQSTELIALTSHDISLFNSTEESSWDLPHNQVTSESLRKDDDMNCERNVVEQPSFEDTFHNCISFQSQNNGTSFDDGIYESQVYQIDGLHHIKEENISAYNKDHIQRINVLATELNIFMALGKSYIEAQNASLQDLHLIRLRSEVGNEEYVYELHDDLFVEEDLKHKAKRSKEPLRELLSRKWHKASKFPINLAVFADFSPHLRIMIKDNIGIKKQRQPTHFDMTMQQFYLCLSTWYGNMQALPVMFPYSVSEVHSAAKSKSVPLDWPEYGTPAWVQYVQDLSPKNLQFELGLDLTDFKWNCSFEDSPYFSKSPWFLFLLRKDKNSRETGSILAGAEISFCHAIFHVIGYNNALLQIGCGSHEFEITDNRKNKTIFSNAISVKKVSDSSDAYSKVKKWADVTWGLDCGRHTLLEDLPLPFQLSLFLTPDKWCSINLGVQNIKGVLDDLSLIWMLLDYFGLYFQQKEFGHPYFEAEDHKNIIKSRLKNQDNVEQFNVLNDKCMNLDIRIWFCHPQLTLPSDTFTCKKPCLLLESNSGIMYRYSSIGMDHSSQEICGKDVMLLVQKELYSTNDRNGHRKGASGSDQDIEIIIEGLTFFFKYDVNTFNNHSTTFLRIPLSDSNFDDKLKMYGIEPPEIRPRKLQLTTPKIVCSCLKPVEKIESKMCDIKGNFECVKLAIDTLTTFVRTPEPPDFSMKSAHDAKPLTHSLSVSFMGVRLLLSDMHMRDHLPVAVFTFPSLILSSSQLSMNDKKDTDDLQFGLDLNIWGSYWNMSLKSWEPLLVSCII